MEAISFLLFVLAFGSIIGFGVSLFAGVAWRWVLLYLLLAYVFTVTLVGLQLPEVELNPETPRKLAVAAFFLLCVLAGATVVLGIAFWKDAVRWCREERGSEWRWLYAVSLEPEEPVMICSLVKARTTWEALKRYGKVRHTWVLDWDDLPERVQTEQRAFCALATMFPEKGEKAPPPPPDFYWEPPLPAPPDILALVKNAPWDSGRRCDAVQWTSKATWVIQTGAENEARLLGMKQVGLEHVLLATLADDEAIPAMALRNLGVTYEQLRSEMLRLHGLKRCAHCGAVLPHPEGGVS